MKKILMIVAVVLMSLPIFAQTADNSDVLRRSRCDACFSRL